MRKVAKPGLTPGLSSPVPRHGLRADTGPSLGLPLRLEPREHSNMSSR